MLVELRISCLGVIDQASAELHSGLTVLTGETGAGKTMVVTSLHLLGGVRADPRRVRAGADRAIVEGRFSTETSTESTQAEVTEMLESAGAEPDSDGSIIAVRTVTSEGRSRAHLGGRSVPASVLGRFTGTLLTVHGQNDQLRLLKPDQQRHALDRFGAEKIAPLVEKYRNARRRWKELAAELNERTTRSRELAQEHDRLTFGLNEIDEVSPQPGEDDLIAAEVRRLGDLDSLREAATSAAAAVAGGGDFGSGNGDDANALSLLGEARNTLETSDDPVLRGLATRAAEAIAVVSDLGAELSGFLSDLPTDPGALDGLLSRQSELRILTRKYAADIDGVIAWASAARERLTKIDVSADALEELTAQVSKAQADVATCAAKLSVARKKAAGFLASAVSAELAGLAMGKSTLTIEVDSTPVPAMTEGAVEIDGQWFSAGPYGVDEVEFRLASHSGAQPMPIAKSASGGELSRVMLALEVVLAGGDGAGTLVFDEVDAGVGGRAAVEIGRRLAKLARTHQVIVVTHLPQVAAYADTHLVVDKQDDSQGGVVSGVRTLTDSERVAELARMLAGMGESDTARAHADELRATAISECENFVTF
ncbi:DNA repair protein RecN [Hoyosella rhizosphaerae]|uniref:DNA repair protein RecN n=1 Tax=Hoyosella rhizosphaerae TaxID=1755582 RepID=A0A916U6W5_9ACTN|nr:DNA repair protein RecN [Hoyosella rhizosphaerae]MBN4926185.1 DNA repair protein RecN [Hoyosella rhizosphaerae]GGC61440.1 DNA repair protein RecN [Hoyosella rhizosphaerae]